MLTQTALVTQMTLYKIATSLWDIPRTTPIAMMKMQQPIPELMRSATTTVTKTAMVLIPFALSLFWVVSI
jgi:hypothetical protein